MTKNIRNAALKFGPRWLTTEGESGLVTFSLFVVADAFLDRLYEGLLARFPTYAQEDALFLIGQDRAIPRGFAEPKDHYVERLGEWRTGWSLAGVGYRLAHEIRGYLYPYDPQIRVVNDTGTWSTVDSSGAESYAITHPSSNWDWGGTGPFRFWPIIYPVGLWTSEGTWGDGADWGDGGTWGTTATKEQVANVRAILAKRKPGGGRCESVIIALDPASFDPSDPPGAPLPDGDWHLWSTGGDGSRVASRLATARYWQGVY